MSQSFVKKGYDTMKKTSLASLLVLTTATAYSAGFSLYEPSTYATAMGGALLGKGHDGSANTINPATLTDITNFTVTVGFVTEHPRARVKTANGGSSPMDPGFFVLPHAHIVAPLPMDFTFGFGMGADYGLGTHYTKDFSTSWNSQETTIQGFVFNPNLAYKVTDKWSVAAGARCLYFDFEQYSYPFAGTGVDRLTRAYGMNTDLEHARQHLKGDNNGRNWGWQLGTSYKIRDDLSVGAVYKSRILTHVRGKTSLHPSNQQVIQGMSRLGYDYTFLSGPASANLEIPQSVAFGANWDITDKLHFGSAVTWTDWSSIDTIHFILGPNRRDNPKHLGWHDSWRFSFAPSYDFTENWTGMMSYVYDTNVCSSNQESTMLPPGDRHILSWGLAWKATENLEFDLCYSLVLMQSSSMHSTDPTRGDFRLECHRGLSHAGGFSVTYRF